MPGSGRDRPLPSVHAEGEKREEQEVAEEGWPPGIVELRVDERAVLRGLSSRSFFALRVNRRQLSATARHPAARLLCAAVAAVASLTLLNGRQLSGPGSSSARGEAFCRAPRTTSRQTGQIQFDPLLGAC